MCVASMQAHAGELLVDNVQEARNVDLTTEGTVDWMHFGLVDATSVNRKAAVTPALTFADSASGNRFGSSGALRSTLFWDDGTPTGISSGFSGGIYYPVQGTSYTFTAPADTTTRTLTLHLGGWNASSSVQLTLSDGSAAPQTVFLTGSAIYHHTVTVTYSADSPGQTLTAVHTFDSGTGNIIVQGATLSASTGNQAPQIAAIGDQTVTESTQLQFTVTATDADGPAPIDLQIASSTPALPVAAQFTDNGNGTGNFSWTPGFADIGSYSVTFRATDDGGAGAFSDETITIDVVANQAPQIAAIGDQQVTEGVQLQFGVTATDADGPAPIDLQIASSTPALPAAAQFTDNGNGTGDFSWTPGAADVDVYSVTFRATDDGGAGDFSEQTITLTVNSAGGGGGSLSVVHPVQSAITNDLTAAGTLDWMHFGRVDATSINRKTAVPAQLSYSLLGGTQNRFGHSATARPSHVWSDGTPTASSTAFSGGFYNTTQGAGFQITAPADTTQRTLTVFLGGWNTTGTLNVSLSDGSAASYSTSLSGASAFTHAVSVVYSAASPGQSVTVSITKAAAGGNVIIQSASLAGPAGNQAPQIAAIGDQTVTEGALLQFSVTATDADGPAPIDLQIASSTPALPVAAQFTDNGNGTGDFSWTPGTADVGSYSVTFRATDDGGAGDFSEQTITLTVNSAGGSGGSLSVVHPVQSAITNDLTAAGTLDWMHFGRVDATSINRKAAVSAQLSYSLLGGTQNRFGHSATARPSHVWSDGTPTASSTAFSGGFYNITQGAGFQITAPADTSERTLTVYLGGWNTTGALNVSLSDGSAASYSTSLSGASAFTHAVTVVYSAASAGQTVTVSITKASAGGNVIIQSASLAGPVGNLPPQIAAIGDQQVTESTLLQFGVTAADADGPAPIDLQIASSTPALPVAAQFTDNSDGTGNFAWTPGFSDIGSYSVTFRATDDGGAGAFSEQTITIDVVANQAPQIAAIGDQQVTEGVQLQFGVTATDADGPAPIDLQISSSTPALPVAAQFVDNGNGTGGFSWTPGTADVGSYSVTFRATDDGGAGNFSEQTITLTVNSAGGGGGTLNASAPSVAPFTNNLTNEGDLDWLHVGLTNVSSVNRKASGGQLISYAAIGSVSGRFGHGPTSRPSHQWSDGTPVASESGFAGGLYYATLNAGFRITVPADTTQRTLSVHLGGWSSTGALSVTLSDGSAAPFSTTLDGVGVYQHLLTIDYAAAADGETLTVEFTKQAGGGNVILQAASLSGPAPSLLPFMDDFADGDMAGWTVVDDGGNPSNWQVASQELRQTNMVEAVGARSETYQLGSYAYWAAGTSLTDYRFEVDFQFTGNNLAEDVGVLFRYQDNNNYYRLSFNGRTSYMRLEKRVAGVFTTLAASARGYTPGESINVVVEIQGSTILIWTTGTGGDTLAVEDVDLTAGTVGVYAKEAARFDNVSVTDPDGTGKVVLQSPLSYSTNSSNTINAVARAVDVPVGGSVRFLLDGGSAVTDATAPYQATFSSVAPGDHTIVAILRNSSGVEIDRDTHVSVGVTGDQVISSGDSLTDGIGDFYTEDNVSASMRSRGFQGYQARLMDQLDATRTLTPTVVFNEGIGGDESVDIAFNRIDSVLERHPDADRLLLLVGTNDTFVPVASGLGCSGAACNGTFKGNVQTIIDKVIWADYPTNTVASNIQPHVALVPPNWVGGTPWSSASNNRIRDYNTVIASELNGALVGPDFFDFFMASASEDLRSVFSDTLHPNSLGYQLMAALWHNNLEPASPVALPFHLTLLDSTGTQEPLQDLIGVGDEIRLGGDTSTLLSIPGALAGGRWILTGDDVANADANYLTFDVDRAVTIYVAYDGGATSRPDWMASYVDSGLDLTTSDPQAPVMDLYTLTASSGSVTLGGNSAIGAAGTNANYVVIVVEN